MSKVEELRLKYPTVTKITFDKLVAADQTPTKKYLDFLLKSWVNRNNNGCPHSVSSQIIKDVKRFDELLPYIENKDIYSNNYNNYRYFIDVLNYAEKIKEEKTFNKDEHVVIYKETDDYIMLQPKTHRGSLRYGAGTRWCTASKNDGSVFRSYTTSGVLMYIIRKNLLTNANYNKIAIYVDYGQDGLMGQLTVYNAADTDVRSGALIGAGWSEETLSEIFTIYRHVYAYQKKYKKIKGEVKTFMNAISALNFENFIQNLAKLEHSVENSYISEIQDNLKVFLEKIKTANNAIGNTKN